MQLDWCWCIRQKHFLQFITIELKSDYVESSRCVCCIWTFELSMIIVEKFIETLRVLRGFDSKSDTHISLLTFPTGNFMLQSRKINKQGIMHGRWAAKKNCETRQQTHTNILNFLNVSRIFPQLMTSCDMHASTFWLRRYPINAENHSHFWVKARRWEEKGAWPKMRFSFLTSD